MSRRAINVNQFIDSRAAMQGAGAWGRGIAGVGSAVSGYAKINYKKKRDEKNDENLKADNATKIKTHELDYAKSTDTAKIKSRGDVKVATIKDGTDRYTIDGKKDIANTDYKKSTDTARIQGKTKLGVAKLDYNKSTDTAKIKSRGDVKVATIKDGTDRYTIDGKKSIARIDYQKSSNSDKSRERVASTTSSAKVESAKIGGRAKVRSSSISASAKRYGADVSASNNRRTTATLLGTTKEKTKTQRYVADRNLEGAKEKRKPKAKESWKVQALRKAKTPKEREAILKMKDIGDEEI